MNINPEFRRNLWLELTPSRLVGMPMILGALLFLAYLLDDKQYGESVAHTALTLFGLLVFVWGTRLASETLVSEIRDHTWDGQRMSVIGPWSMTWGKLLGSTIYPWYGALICLLVYLTSRPAAGLTLAETTILLLGCGLFSQAIGLLSSLQAIRKSQRFGRFQTTAFLVMGAGSALTVLSWVFSGKGDLFWYGQDYDEKRFILTSLVVFLAWAVFGIYRLIRAELQLRSRPWAWGAFVLFMMAYVAGFAGGGGWEMFPSLLQQRLLSAFLVGLSLAYGAVFFERKDPVALRRLLQALGQSDWRRAVTFFPLWLSTLPFVVLSCLLLAVQDLSLASVDGGELFAVPALAMLCFLLRDFALLLYLNLGRNPKRADMLTVLWLALLYGVIPTICKALDATLLAGLFWPLPNVAAQYLLPSAFLQAVVVLWMMVRRWRKNQRLY